MSDEPRTGGGDGHKAEQPTAHDVSASADASTPTGSTFDSHAAPDSGAASNSAAKRGAQHAYAASAEERHATPKRKVKPRWGRILALVMAFVLLAVLAVVGIYIWRANDSIKRSGALGDTRTGGDLDILIMGLDSRVDVNGNELPAEIYDALHSGDASDGGLNSNVLMYVHIPEDGSQASIISIPRDDYVDFPGCPDGVCQGKIKEAYSYGADEKTQELAAEGKADDDAYQQARDAGRAAEVKTVEQFLGVEIDHFIEVTMVAFFQIAEVVQPITVCVNQDTVDTYSGADFKAGEQQINAEQAMAFVRQRRDTNDESLAFTDLDRSRRQQAFMASLLVKLKETNLLTNPGQLDSLVKVAQQNTVLDKNLKISDLTSLASSLDGSNLNFYTLPVEEFGTSEDGASINVVDEAKIKAIVQSILNPDAASASASATPSYAADYGAGVTLSVVNESSVSGAAAALIDQLGAYGFTAGVASNGVQVNAETTISYGSNAQSQAESLASQLGGVQATADSSLGADEVVVHLGTDFTAWPSGDPNGTSSDESGSGSEGSTDSTGSSTAVPSAVEGTGTDSAAPEPTELTQMSGGGIQCVK